MIAIKLYLVSLYSLRFQFLKALRFSSITKCKCVSLLIAPVWSPVSLGELAADITTLLNQLVEEMLQYFVPEMWQRGLRVLDVSCARADYYQTSGRIIRMIRPYWKGVVMGGASFTREEAEKEIEDELLDLVTWGRFLIADFDLVRRMENNEGLTAFDPTMLRELV